MTTYRALFRWFGRSVMGKFEVLEAMDVSWLTDAIGY